MNKKKFILILSIFAIVIVLGGAVFVWNNNRNSENIESKTETVTNQSDSANKTVAEYLSGNKNLSSFTELLNTAGLFSQLSEIGPYTVFAPNNDSFKNMPEGYYDIIFKSSNPQTASNILSYHIVPGNLDSTLLTSGLKMKTQNGQELIVELADDNIYIIDAKSNKAIVKTANIKTTNGVVYIIDKVLLPQ
jgi:uncharacterized surface protein with fasciclin (FAS1) repeats